MNDYEVYTTGLKGKGLTLKKVASYPVLDRAIEFIANSEFASPFDCTKDSDILDILYRGRVCLFVNPRGYHKLCYAEQLPPGTTKEDIIKVQEITGEFDYAVPQVWVEEVVENLKPTGKKRETLYSHLTCGVVWHYPVDGLEAFGGRPMALTLDTHDLLVKDVQLYVARYQ